PTAQLAFARHVGFHHRFQFSGLRNAAVVQRVGVVDHCFGEGGADGVHAPPSVSTTTILSGWTLSASSESGSMNSCAPSFNGESEMIVPCSITRSASHDSQFSPVTD